MRKANGMLLVFVLVLTCTTIMAGVVSAAAETTTITLNGSSGTMNGTGATIVGNIITITSAGTYNLRGMLNEGQIRVDTQDTETVKLVLDGMEISNSTSAPIYIVNAEKTVINLAGGTMNTVTDGNSYVAEETGSDEPNAAIFSKDDLTINGDGSLTVDANYNDGITSKDDLKINGGIIIVNAVKDGIRGRDSVIVKGGTTTINAVGDGIQSNNDEDTAKGYVSIEDGTINIVAGADGIQAETSLTVNDGDIKISSGGSSSNASAHQNPGGNPGMGNNVVTTDTPSAKGLKAGVALAITGGTITIDSSDDSLHSNGSITISGGDIDLASGDDAIHSDSTIEINSGDIFITKSYEGIESGGITINDGTIHLVSSDDGINAVSDSDVSITNGQPGMGNTETGNSTLQVNGGYIIVNAGGDGLDVNGPITLNGGVVIVNGPTDDSNGAIDYTGSFKVTGGTLVAAGSSGMAQAPDTSSTQYSVMMTYASAQPAGTMVHVETNNSEDILTFVPTKTYQSVVFCMPDLASGEEYNVYSGGSSTGTVTDGLYSGGVYTPGTQVATFTISGIVTNAGSSGGGGAPGPNPGTPTWGPTMVVTTAVPTTKITTAIPTTVPTTNVTTAVPTTKVTTAVPTKVPTTKVTTAVPTTAVPVVQNGQAYFSTTPLGASIIIDGVPANAVTPIYMKVPVGPHQVTFRLVGYNDLLANFTITTNARTTISGRLVSGSGNQNPVTTVVTTIPTTTVTQVTTLPTIAPTMVPTPGSSGMLQIPSWAKRFLSLFRVG
jgi:hypothetical protein